MKEKVFEHVSIDDSNIEISEWLSEQMRASEYPFFKVKVVFIEQDAAEDGNIFDIED